MPLFFDLNLPCSGAAAAASHRDARLRSAVQLLSLGYAGLAYNVSLRFHFSDKDRCTVAPFPLSSLLAAAPALAASAGLHRRLLGSGGEGGSGFRQFSRVTVSVETASQAGSVGASNAVLRGYDVVGIRPMSQSAFDHACKCSEVDLISIDFSQKLPFRLRHQSVELAIKRGLYFEITYSQLLSENSNIKRQMISDAKLLVEWTRGKNIIVTSGAFNASEIRGPNDISNLISFLLGFSKQRAKSAISDNCRALLAKALRRKHYHKETIRVERIMNNNNNNNNNLIGDWINWDPISSGEGDLPALEKLSNISSLNNNNNINNNNKNNSKAIDFDSIVNDKPFLLSQQDKIEINKVSYDLMELDCDNDSVLRKCEIKNDQIALELKENSEVRNSEPIDISENEIEKDQNTLESNEDLEETKIEFMENESEKDQNTLESNEDLGDEIIARDNLINDLMGEDNMMEKVEEMKSEKELERVSENEIVDETLERNLLNNLMDEEAKREDIEEMKSEKEFENENVNYENSEGLNDNIEERENIGSSSNSSFLNKVLSDLGDKNEDKKTPLKQGKRKNKNRVRNPVCTLPFKGFLKTVNFKRKRRKQGN